VSIDSFNEDVNAKIGRGTGKHLSNVSVSACAREQPDIF
jgi:hypothetical protein